MICEMWVRNWVKQKSAAHIPRAPGFEPSSCPALARRIPLQAFGHQKEVLKCHESGIKNHGATLIVKTETCAFLVCCPLH
eukprot:jgi/Botrbrau1/23340/Bobra.0667s0002.1